MDFIDSKYTKSRYENMGFYLTDFNKATLIWNKSLSRKDKMETLSELGKYTLDAKLKMQISERLCYEEKLLMCFQNNSGEDIVYVVKDSKDDCVWGFFSKFNTALTQAKKVALENNLEMSIEKQLIVTGDKIVKVRSRANLNLFPDVSEIWIDYNGAPLAVMHLNDKGDIVSLWSNELPEEEKKVDSYDKERFEFQFFSVPYVHQKGLPVKNVITGEYGILETGKEDWDEFLEKVNNGLYVDFSDIVHTVYCLTENGYWTHDHWNPMEIEVEMLAIGSSDKKTWALVRALEALADYMSGYTYETQVELVLRTTREYAEVCREMRELEKIANEPVSIEDILC